MKNALLLCVSFLFFLTNCKTNKYTPADYPKAQISFGSGGGFAGTYSTYILLENGQLFKKGKEKGEYIAMGRKSANQVNQLFKNYHLLGLDQVQYDEPDNMSYYIGYKEGGNEHNITWGGLAKGLKPEVKLFYKLLTQLHQEQKK